MAIPPNIIHAGLRTGFQALIDAVERGDDLPTLQKKQRGLLMLSQMAQQLTLLDQERAESLRALEQLDIQNTIATVGRLLKLQRQLNDAVVKDLTAQLENTSLTILHLENTFVRKAITDQKTIELLQQQHLEMRDQVGRRFGKGSWQKYFGDVGVEPPLPLNIQTILEAPCPFWPGRKVKETHLLNLIPKAVNGQPLTLNSLEQLIQNPKQGNKTRYRCYTGDIKKERGNTPVQYSHWVLIPRDVIPGSREKIYPEQQKLVAQYPSYQVAQTLEIAVCISIEYVVSGTGLLCDQNSWTYTRCEEKIKGYQVIVGGSGADGFCINGYSRWSFDSDGIAPVRRL